jgi:hypothetical protein
MVAHTCEIDSVAIVLVGSFNPPIFQPRWLGAKGFVRGEEADSADVKLSPDMSAFSLGDWLTMEVRSDRFTAIAADIAHAGPLLDLVVGLFRILEHTPFHKLGINRHMHYRMGTDSARMALGRVLVPPAPWMETMTSPLMRSLTMQGKRPGSPAVHVNVTVEPSPRVQPLTRGVYVVMNEHFEKPEDNIATAGHLLDLLASEWQPSLDFGKSIAEHILSTETAQA